MAVLLALIPDHISRARLTAALERFDASGLHHEAVHAESWSQLYELARKRPATLAIVDPFREGKYDVANCSRFFRSFPSVGFLPYSKVPASEMKALLHMARLGAREIVLQDENDSPSQFCQLLSQALASSTERWLFQQLRECVPQQFRKVVRFALREGYRPLSPAELARIYCTHPKTLRLHLRKAGLPSPQRLIGWTRLMHAASYIGDSGRTVESVALALGFPSESALRKMVRTYVGVATRELDGSDGLNTIVEAFKRSLRGSESSSAIRGIAD